MPVILTPGANQINSPRNYDCYSVCPCCSGDNELLDIYSDEGYVYEVRTRCPYCGHRDYWAYGYYEFGTHYGSDFTNIKPL